MQKVWFWRKERKEGRKGCAKSSKEDEYEEFFGTNENVKQAGGGVVL
jgi:hypothetical protein